MIESQRMMIIYTTIEALLWWFLVIRLMLGIADQLTCMAMVVHTFGMALTIYYVILIRREDVLVRQQMKTFD